MKSKRKTRYDARVRNSFDRQKVMSTLGISIAELSPAASF
tara:strand:+ start:224 stop:343 length:120 start_codon:yes stop_codon:yes gene_type:complete